MAIKISTGFSIGSKDLIDDRLVLSKEQMLNINESIYPDHFFSLCSDDNKIYVYNQANTPNDATGKFVVYVGTDGTTGASIDDGVISPDTTYSSNKIETDFAKKEELHTHDNKDVLDTITEEKINEWDAKSDFSGSYNDLTDAPTIPTKTSELTNDSNFITTDDIPNIIEDTQASNTTTYSSNKIENDFQKINDNTLTTDDKTISGSINELDAEIGIKGFKTIPESYIKVYRNILEQPNGKIANGNKCQSTIGQGMLYIPKRDYVLYHIKNNDVIENSLQDGHTYTLTYNSNSNATVEYFIFDYAVDSMDIKCIAKETVTSGTKITMPTNSYWFQMNTLKSDNITNISLVDDAFPYDNIRLVVADGNVSDTNTQIAVSTIGDIASVGEYIKLIPETIGMDSTGIYKYIDDKVGSGTGSGASTANAVEYINDTVGSNNVEEALNKLIADYYYVAPKVNSFTASPTGGLFEVGTTITAPITFNWDYNKDITSQTLTDCTLADETIRTATYDTDITTNKTFTLSATDGTNNVSKSISYTFVSASYTGVTDTVPTTDTEITALTKSVRTKANLTQAFTTSGLQTIVYAYPSSFGNLTSIINQNNYEVLTNFALSNITVNGVVYNVYSLSNVNLDNFKYTFKY